MSEKKNGWRGSREAWLEAARREMLDNGESAVTIQRLAASLKISRGSFYWFFDDRDALMASLLDHWDQKNTTAILNGCEDYAETITEAALNLIYVFISEAEFDPRFDFAIRAWAIRSASVNERVTYADNSRIEAIRGMFTRHGFSNEAADVRAHTAYLVQTGYIALQIVEPLETRLERALHYAETFTGSKPTNSEFSRFCARFTQQKPVQVISLQTQT